MAPPADAVALRAEHDRLAEALSIRHSVDQMKVGGVLTFFVVIAFGLTAKLGWDRWGWLPVNKPKPEGEYPLFFLAMALVACVVLFNAVRAFRRAAALRREEDEQYARLMELRRALELDT
jgi:hypothetical protein